ncbi:hypothetical protein DKX38_023143 [Salix brachista]|uniref:Uncharacterized protein n=1 Tax=Salix brachista TaxID=2182728 RepID=A0A5N5K4E9_9ROSI|nr:hypothetical protein DKX38_023143 [Salix brachista]
MLASLDINGEEPKATVSEAEKRKPFDIEAGLSTRLSKYKNFVFLAFNGKDDFNHRDGDLCIHNLFELEKEVIISYSWN